MVPGGAEGTSWRAHWAIGYKPAFYPVFNRADA